MQKTSSFVEMMVLFNAWIIYIRQKKGIHINTERITANNTVAIEAVAVNAVDTAMIVVESSVVVVLVKPVAVKNE